MRSTFVTAWELRVSGTLSCSSIFAFFGLNQAIKIQIHSYSYITFLPSQTSNRISSLQRCSHEICGLEKIIPNQEIDIRLVAPPASAPAIQTALNTNPYLTALPLPKPELIAPKDLDQTTGTAQIFRLPEVREEIKGDFIVLPCDIICELEGEALLQAWMVKQAGLGGATGGNEEFKGPKMSQNGEKGGRRGGLGVWYETKVEVPTGALGVKKEETDFLATAHFNEGPVPYSQGPISKEISQVVMAFPTDTLKDIIAMKAVLPVRQSLLKTYGDVRMLTTHRDAHIYIFPAWVLDMINENDDMDNLSEDVIGSWAKASWQKGFAEKLGLRQIFNPESGHSRNDGDEPDKLDVDIASLSSTCVSTPKSLHYETYPVGTPVSNSASTSIDAALAAQPLVVPPMLAYTQPAQPFGASPIIRRVDTSSLLLSISLQLAKLPALDTVGKAAASPFAHPTKIANPSGVAQRSYITHADCLVDVNVTVQEKASVKECVIGANCHIGEGAKLFRCVLMEGVTIEKNAKVNGTILGRHAVVGQDSVLIDCEVEDFMKIEAKTEAKAEKFRSSEGLEATEEEFEEAYGDDSNDVQASD